MQQAFGTGFIPTFSNGNFNSSTPFHGILSQNVVIEGFCHPQTLEVGGGNHHGNWTTIRNPNQPPYGFIQRPSFHVESHGNPQPQPHLTRSHANNVGQFQYEHPKEKESESMPRSRGKNQHPANSSLMLCGVRIILDVEKQYRHLWRYVNHRLHIQ